MVEITQLPSDKTPRIEVLKSNDNLAETSCTEINPVSITESDLNTDLTPSRSDVIATATSASDFLVESQSCPESSTMCHRRVIRQASLPLLLVDGEDHHKSKRQLTNLEWYLSWLFNGMQDCCELALRCGWECSQKLIQEVCSLITLIGTAVNHDEGSKTLRSGEKDSETELINLMETQTHTLLELNKFLREEVNVIKEEREMAERMIAKIEQKCREAIEQNRDHISTHDLFALLYGASSQMFVDKTQPLGAYLGNVRAFNTSAAGVSPVAAENQADSTVHGSLVFPQIKLENME